MYRSDEPFLPLLQSKAAVWRDGIPEAWSQPGLWLISLSAVRDGLRDSFSHLEGRLRGRANRQHSLPQTSTRTHKYPWAALIYKLSVSFHLHRGSIRIRVNHVWLLIYVGLGVISNDFVHDEWIKTWALLCHGHKDQGQKREQSDDCKHSAVFISSFNIQ